MIFALLILTTIILKLMGLITMGWVFIVSVPLVIFVVVGVIALIATNRN